MTYSDFYGWVQKSRFLALPLIVLFIFGTIFQVTDTFDRVKQWFQPETHNILHIKSSLDYLGEGEGVLNRAEGDEELFHQFSLSTKPSQNKTFIKALLSGSNDLWLVRAEGTDVLVPAANIDGADAQVSLPVGLIEDLPFAMEIKARDGEGTLLISIQFPNIDPSRPWADFENVPVTCCYGWFKHTAFYRFTEYKDKGQLPYMRNFKAQYIEPDAELARTLLEEIETGAYQQLYFKQKPEPENE